MKFKETNLKATTGKLRFMLLLIIGILLTWQESRCQEINAWGNNGFGQLNVPTSLAGITDIAVGHDHVLALQKDGTVAAWGQNQFGQMNIPGSLSGVIAVAAGLGFSTALKSDGTVVAWGKNDDDQIEVPGSLSDVKAISAGRFHSVALKSDGTVIAWGSNSLNQTNVPASLAGVKSISCAVYGAHTLALKSDGTVTAWGFNTSGQGNVPANLTDVVAVSAGAYHSLALKADGTVVAWGDNGVDQCNVPGGLTDVIQIAAGAFFGMALKSDGTVVTWGTIGSVIPTGLSGVTAIYAGAFAAVALRGWYQYRTDGWGANSDGQIAVFPDIKEISSGAYHTAGLRSDGTVDVWGWNGEGQRNIPAGLQAKKIYSGRSHMLALKADGTVTAWGDNANGQSDIPPGLSNVIMVAGGGTLSAALKADGTVVAWGDNSFGQCNVPPSLSGVISISAGIYYVLALKADGTAVAWGRNSSGECTIPGTLNGVKALAAGVSHSLALTATGDVVAWGSNNNSVSTVPAGAINVKAIANGGFHNVALKIDGTVVCWGDNTSGKSTVPGSIKPVRAISAGRDHSAVIIFDQAPELSGVTTSVGYTEGASSVALGNVQSIGNDDTFIKGAVISIAAGFLTGDVLSITPGTLTPSYNTSTGVLTLSGTESPANYNTIIQSLKYHSTDVAPATNSARTITITVNDGVKTSEPLTFLINITSVNDVPSFTKGANISISEDASLQTNNGWATAISKGPADESTQTVTFDASNDNNSLFSVQPAISSSGNLTFTPMGNATGTATVTVSLKDNGGITNSGVDQSADETFTITVNPVNDVPSFTKGANISISEDGGLQNNNGWATAISKGPANEASQGLTFNISNNNNGLFSVQPAISSTGNLTFTPMGNASGTATVTVSLKDDGGTANSGVDQSAGQTFTITVNPVNDVPSFAKGTDISISEDATAQTHNGWATSISKGPADEVAQILTFNVSNNNNNLFSVQPSISNTGELTFTSAANETGTATVTVVLNDDGGTANGGVNQTASQTFTITVDPVNDPPSFTAGADITLDEDAAAQSTNNWTTAISAGPVNEASQTLAFTLTNDNSSLFSVQPALDVAGRLTFTPAAGNDGTATVTVTLKDNGGTAQGGDDLSTQTFTITIRGVNDAPSFTKGVDITLAEDALPYSSAWAANISAGDPGQTLTFMVTAAHPDLFTIQPLVSASGILSFQLKPDAFGSSVLTIYVKDNGGTTNGGVDQSSTETFNIVVNPVNDAPFVDQAADITVPVNSEPIVVTLSGVHVGATGEENQQLTVEASSDNASVLPGSAINVAQNGTISITLSPLSDATGTATIAVKIKDNGGTTAGGKDETVMSFLLIVEEAVQAVFVPNLFSPEGNGTNDAFRVRGAGIGQIRFSIYNINGQELFTTTDVTTATVTGWDGTYKGKDLPAGTYTWTLQGRHIDGRPLTTQKTQFGQVILIR